MSNLILDNDKSYLIYPCENGIITIEILTRLNYLRSQRKFQLVFDLLPKDMINKITQLTTEGNKYTLARNELIKQGKLNDTLDAELTSLGAEVTTETNVSKQEVLLDIADSLLVVKDDKECFNPKVSILVNELFGKTMLFKDDNTEIVLLWNDNITEHLSVVNFRALLGMTMVFIYASCRLSLPLNSAQTITWDKEGTLQLEELSSNFIKGSDLNNWREYCYKIKQSTQQVSQDTCSNNVSQLTTKTIPLKLKKSLKITTKEA